MVRKGCSERACRTCKDNVLPRESKHCREHRNVSDKQCMGRHRTCYVQIVPVLWIKQKHNVRGDARACTRAQRGINRNNQCFFFRYGRNDILASTPGPPAMMSAVLPAAQLRSAFTGVRTHSCAAFFIVLRIQSGPNRCSVCLFVSACAVACRCAWVKS